jgi:outer membrane protein OmpA-like peptidoglycan-associated protein
MHTSRLLPFAAVALLAACNTTPQHNMTLDQAREDYNVVQADPKVTALASLQLKQASDALNTANEAWRRSGDSPEVNHLAYVAKQRVAIARETAMQKGAEGDVADASATRDSVRLAARTTEADAAQRSAVSSQQQAELSNQQAAVVQERNRALEAQLKDLNAKQTSRGYVITIGDVLFDTNKSDLRVSGSRNMEKLVGFLNQYPQRRAMIEGFTDSSGSDAHNLTLSGQRADAVRSALVDRGIDASRLETHGYGEANPVASNDHAQGRQLNRRVEIILSDENGKISSR